MLFGLISSEGWADDRGLAKAGRPLLDSELLLTAS